MNSNLVLELVKESDIKSLYYSYSEYLDYLKTINVKAQKPTLEQHTKLFMTYLHDNKNSTIKFWYVLKINNEMIGNISVKKNGEFGYKILDKFRGKEYATKMFEMFFKIHPQNTVWARTKSTNKLSQEILKKFGYELTDLEYHYKNT